MSLFCPSVLARAVNPKFAGCIFHPARCRGRRNCRGQKEHRKNIEEHEGFHVISFIYCILYSVASLLSRCVCLKKEARLQNREQIEPSSGDSPFAEHANFPVIWMPCLASVTSAQSSGDAPVSTCVSRYLRTRNDSGHWISLRN